MRLQAARTRCDRRSNYSATAQAQGATIESTTGLWRALRNDRGSDGPLPPRPVSPIIRRRRTARTAAKASRQHLNQMITSLQPSDLPRKRDFVVGAATLIEEQPSSRVAPGTIDLHRRDRPAVRRTEWLRPPSRPGASHRTTGPVLDRARRLHRHPLRIVERRQGPKICLHNSGTRFESINHAL
jgi:hypothetical protein